MSKRGTLTFAAGAFPIAASVAVPCNAVRDAAPIDLFPESMTGTERSSYPAGVAGDTMLHAGDADIDPDSSGVHSMESVDRLAGTGAGSRSIGELDGDRAEGLAGAAGGGGAGARCARGRHGVCGAHPAMVIGGPVNGVFAWTAGSGTLYVEYGPRPLKTRSTLAPKSRSAMGSMLRSQSTWRSMSRSIWLRSLRG